jgi:biotin carboxyl carrier protein
LKVKPGDQVIPGQILSDRTTERQRLLNQKQQLQLSLKKLEIPIPALNAPKSLSVLRKLPPISYQQQEANISLKRQELREAESAIANQEEKIKQLQQLSVNSQPSTVNDLSIQNPQSKIQNPDNSLMTDNSLITVIEHEQAIGKQLEDNREKAQLQLKIAQTQLTEAQEKRQQEEYQLHLEENRRAIALQNQQLELERQRTLRAGQLQEREYSQAQIQAKIQEVENAIAQLSTVKAPYSGTVKKVKWKGQSDHTLTVELTLAVADGGESGGAPVPGQH